MPLVPATPPVPAPEPVAPATIATWPAHRTEVVARLAPALAYLDGLLSRAERKNGWQLAEVNGDADPYGI